jgi:hypothetical protein
MIVSRVVGAAAAVATKTLMDAESVATLRVDAKYPSSKVDISVETQAGSLANTRKLVFKSAYLGITETFDNFKITVSASEQEAINAGLSALSSIQLISQRSRLVNLINLASGTLAPNNLPAISAASALAGGSDDFAGVNAAIYESGLAAFEDEHLGTGQVSIPGISSAHAALIAHAEKFQRLALLDPALGLDIDEIIAVSEASLSSHRALYYPYVRMRDLAGGNLLKFYPPSIIAAGECAKADRKFGTHKAPANLGIVPNALDVERNADDTPLFNDNMREVLNRKRVNVIAPLPGEGIKVYGARVGYPDGDLRVQFVHERRMLCLISHSVKKGYAWAPFSVVDGQGRLFRDLVATGKNFLRPFWRAGALFGVNEEEAFLVKCDRDNNPDEELATGLVKVQIAVKLSPTAERILILVDNVPLGQDLSGLNGQ